jgi:hypothetical protein
MVAVVAAKVWSRPTITNKNLRKVWKKVVGMQPTKQLNDFQF